MSGIDFNEVDHLIEIQGYYDGWSAAVLKDGTVVNRWAGKPGYEARAARVQDWLDEMIAQGKTL